MFLYIIALYDLAIFKNKIEATAKHLKGIKFNVTKNHLSKLISKTAAAV